ncbi:MAG: molybdopterin molybdotransferase MoeA [Flavobacteriaceae bacterium]|nr:molybdopterin molybdotransferase MoeA [Flavobacteriaceae bacterium]
MISISQAQSIISQTVSSTYKIKAMHLHDALNYILAEDVISKINMPPFRQSAMDGYALHLHNNTIYSIINEIKAGDNANPNLKKGEATRIFTGAAVPDSANAIIIQENASIDNDTLTCHKTTPLNANIRPLGEQITRGEIALKKGSKLTPAAIGYLTSLGVTTVKVYNKPKIAVVITGNELVSPGTPLAHGQIYESNALMLKSSLQSLNYNNISIHKVKDDYNITKQTLDTVISTHDFVLISGGISVGDYDFVGKALSDLNVHEHFYKIKQKPGKPMFFGQRQNTYIFALPGNPASAMSCFYIYVYPALESFIGHANPQLLKVRASTTSDFYKKGNRPQFMKAIYHNNEVQVLSGQASSMLHTFALANALVLIPEDRNAIKKNDLLETYILPSVNL